LPEVTYGSRQTISLLASSHGEEPEAREQLRYFLEVIIFYTMCALQIEHPEHLHTVIIDKE
jgi:hypothetical protein